MKMNRMDEFVYGNNNVYHEILMIYQHIRNDPNDGTLLQNFNYFRVPN